MNMHKAIRLSVSILMLLTSATSTAQINRSETKAVVANRSAKPKIERVIAYDTICESWRLIEKREIEHSSFICDKFENIFCLEKVKDNKRILKLLNDTFVSYNPVNEKIWNIFLDQEGVLYAFVGPLYNRRHYQLQNGTSWKEITDTAENKRITQNIYDGYKEMSKRHRFTPLPADLKKCYFVNYPVNKNMMICEDPADLAKGCVYQYINNKWEKSFSFFTGAVENHGFNNHSNYYGDRAIVTGKTIYILEGDKFWKNDGKIRITEIKEKKPDNFKMPFFAGKEEDRKEAEGFIPEDIGIFEESGKLGLKTKAGKVVVYPVFNKITFEKTPNTELQEYLSVTKYMYHLVGDGMDFYCEKHIDNKEFIGGYVISKEKAIVGKTQTCNNCNNKGEITITEKENIQKWVKAKTVVTGTNTSTQTHADIYSDKKGATVTTTRTTTSTKTIPGHYEDVGTKMITKTIICPVCKGKSSSGSAITLIQYYGARYNYDTKKYVEYIYNRNK